MSCNKNAIQIFTHNQLVQCIISLMTSPPIIRPATPGTKELLAEAVATSYPLAFYEVSF